MPLGTLVPGPCWPPPQRRSPPHSAAGPLQTRWPGSCRSPGDTAALVLLLSGAVPLPEGWPSPRFPTQEVSEVSSTGSPRGLDRRVPPHCGPFSQQPPTSLPCHTQWLGQPVPPKTFESRCKGQAPQHSTSLASHKN